MLPRFLATLGLTGIPRHRHFSTTVVEEGRKGSPLEFRCARKARVNAGESPVGAIGRFSTPANSLIRYQQRVSRSDPFLPLGAGANGEAPFLAGGSGGWIGNGSFHRPPRCAARAAIANRLRKRNVPQSERETMSILARGWPAAAFRGRGGQNRQRAKMARGGEVSAKKTGVFAFLCVSMRCNGHRLGIQHPSGVASFSG